MPNRKISNVIAGQALITATRDMTVRNACRLMAEKRIGAMLVVENLKIVAFLPSVMHLTRSWLPALIRIQLSFPR